MKSGVSKRVAAHLRTHHEWYWVPLLYAAVFIWIYRHIFFPGDGPQVGFGWDSIESYWSDVAFMADQLGGDWPQWNPYDKAGYPYFALPERGSYYPINWLLAWMGAVIGDVPWWVMQLKDYLHHVLAAVCMHLFLRHRGLPRTAALVGGGAWMASAPWLIHKASAILWPMTWIPLLWLVIDRVIERATWRRACALAAVLALAGHSGSTPGFFYTLLTAVPYGLFRVSIRLRDARKQGQLLKVSKRLGIALGIAALLTIALLLVTYIPASELTALSNRTKRGMSYVLMFPLPAGDTLLGLLSPSNGKIDAYAGITVMVLLVSALTVRPLRDRGAGIYFAVMAAFFMALSFGDATPLLRWLAGHVPGFDLFRISNRYKLLAIPCIAAAAGYGAANLMHASRRWKRERFLGLAGIAALLATVVAIVILRPVMPGKWPSDTHSLLLVAVAGALAAGALLTSRRFTFVFVLAMIPLIAYEPQHWVHHTNKAVEKKTDHREDLAWIEGLEDVRTKWRIYDEFVLGQRVGPRLGIKEFRGYPAGGSLEYKRYHRVIMYAKRAPEILKAFSIRYIFHGAHHRAGKRPNHLKRRPDKLRPKHYKQIHIPRCKKLRNPRACPVFEAINPVAPVRWYGAIAIEPKDQGGPVLNAVRRQLDSPQGLRWAVIEKDGLDALGAALTQTLSAAASDAPAPVDGEILLFEANRIRVRVVAPSAGIVVVNETMYPGWKPYVDGSAKTPFFANWLSRGVAVDAGEHVIEWRFEPALNTPLRWVWALAFFALIGAAVWPRRRDGDDDGDDDGDSDSDSSSSSSSDG